MCSPQASARLDSGRVTHGRGSRGWGLELLAENRRAYREVEAGCKGVGGLGTTCGECRHFSRRCEIRREVVGGDGGGVVGETVLRT